MTGDYTTVTETWGLPASPEQLAMQYFRYRMGAELGEGGTVLEIGCGSGMGLPYLQAHASVTVGGDYTMGLLREARRHLPDANLVRMDAQHLPFLDRAFDAVLMLEMIYYVADQEAALAECRRVLKPGGKLLVCMPNRDRPDFNPSPYSTRYPNLGEISSLLTSARSDPGAASTYRSPLPADPQLHAGQIDAQARPVRQAAAARRGA